MSRLKSSSSKRAPPAIGLFMECDDEELSPAQKEFYGKIKKDHHSFKKKLDDYLLKMKGDVVVQEGDCFLFQISASLNVQPALNVAAPAIAPSQPATRVVRSPPVKVPATRGRRPKVPAPAVAPVVVKSTRPAAQPVTPPAPSSISTRKKSPSVIEKPTEASAVGGLSVGSKITTNAFAGTGRFENDADSKEIVVGKTPGKTYPSLTIIARPHRALKPEVINQGQTERANLDVQVKGVLMYNAAKFTEWLIQQGLVRSAQYCPLHNGVNVSPINTLKLGMYSDVTKFPYSGGYVWISDCCPSQFVSVFAGSIFEGAPHVPNVILKLIYHWACQTNVPNVIQWVKVDSLYVKNTYTILRAVCSLAVQEKYGKLGGRGKKVQIGSISLGAIAGSQNVSVIGAMEVEPRKLRLMVVDSEGKHAASKRRTVRMILQKWIDPNSTVLIDSSVERSSVQSVGFSSIVDLPADCAKEVMDYLRRVVSRLFQNTLAMLSKPLIQQFLDELVWRERWGPIAAQAFNNLVLHLADLTSSSKDTGVLKKLLATASNPFVLPTLPPAEETTPVKVPEEGSKRGRKRLAEAASSSSPPEKKSRSPKITDQPSEKEIFWNVQPSEEVSQEVSAYMDANASVALDSYYYGTLPGDDSKIIDRKPAEVVSVKCCICLKSFLDSLALMKHLLLHCQIKPIISGPLRKIHQCPQCFLGFSTASVLRQHTADVHQSPEQKKNLICLICDKLFANRLQLLYHMHRIHIAMELPYLCQVCGHRSSHYNAIIEHFIQAHRGGQHIFCPHCLKAVGLCRGNSAVPENVVFFVNHIQRHLRQTGAQCHRCRLSFVSAPLLQRHLEQDHSSFLYNNNVRPLSNSSGVMMPEPGNLIKPALLPRSSLPTGKPGIYTVKDFPTPLKVVVDGDLSCAECEGSLVTPGHFKEVVKCSKCSYTSNCEVAVAEHYALYHDNTASVAFTPGKPISQVATMYCSCGFFSSSFNNLAKHLVKCGKITAYASETSARAARIKKTYTTPNDEPHMLNLLGLVRKSPEPTARVEEPVAEKDVVATSETFDQSQEKSSNETISNVNLAQENNDDTKEKNTESIIPTPKENDKTDNLTPVVSESSNNKTDEAETRAIEAGDCQSTVDNPPSEAKGGNAIAQPGEFSAMETDSIATSVTNEDKPTTEEGPLSSEERIQINAMEIDDNLTAPAEESPNVTENLPDSNVSMAVDEVENIEANKENLKDDIEMVELQDQVASESETCEMIEKASSSVLGEETASGELLSAAEESENLEGIVSEPTSVTNVDEAVENKECHVSETFKVNPPESDSAMPEVEEAVLKEVGQSTEESENVEPSASATIKDVEEAVISETSLTAENIVPIEDSVAIHDIEGEVPNEVSQTAHEIENSAETALESDSATIHTANDAILNEVNQTAQESENSAVIDSESETTPLKDVEDAVLNKISQIAEISENIEAIGPESESASMKDFEDAVLNEISQTTEESEHISAIGSESESAPMKDVEDAVLNEISQTAEESENIVAMGSESESTSIKDVEDAVLNEISQTAHESEDVEASASDAVLNDLSAETPENEIISEMVTEVSSILIPDVVSEIAPVAPENDVAVSQDEASEQPSGGEKEAAGSLIEELEDIMDAAAPAGDASDFISDLVDPQSQDIG